MKESAKDISVFSGLETALAFSSGHVFVLSVPCIDCSILVYKDDDAVYERWREIDGLVGVVGCSGETGRVCWRRKSCCAAAKLLAGLSCSVLRGTFRAAF
jgi:predicted ATP-grasp superfamily ATP-dependent carboligase